MRSSSMSMQRLQNASLLLVMVSLPMVDFVPTHANAGIKIAHVERYHSASQQQLLSSGASAASDGVSFVKDGTVADNSAMTPGQHFIKTWVLSNSGSTTWASGDRWVLQAGAAMGSAHDIGVPQLDPGQTVNVSASLIAPTSPGAYKSWWQMTRSDGSVFGQQAWVSIQVIKSTSKPTSSPTSLATSRPTITPRPTPTLTPTIVPTVTPSPRPIEIAKTATPVPIAAPTAVLVNTWIGPITWRRYFAEGYTGTGFQEYVAVLNLHHSAANVRFTVMRTDGATKTFVIAVGAKSRVSIHLNAYAADASSSLILEADKSVIAERSLFDDRGNGSTVAAADKALTMWYVPEGYVGQGYSDGLRIFVPGARDAQVTVTGHRASGPSFIINRRFRAGRRSNVDIAALAPSGAISIDVKGSQPLIVESIIGSTTTLGHSRAMALTGPALDWYFPDGGTDKGNNEYVSIYNPQRGSVRVQIHPVEQDITHEVITLMISAHHRATVRLRNHIVSNGLAIVVHANHSIVVQTTRYSRSGAVTIQPGASKPRSEWIFADGYTGTGFSEWITLLNAGRVDSRVTLQLLGRTGHESRLVTVVGPMRSRAISLEDKLPHGPVSVVVTSDHPIVAGRTMIFNHGRGLDASIGIGS